MWSDYCFRRFNLVSMWTIHWKQKPSIMISSFLASATRRIIESFTNLFDRLLNFLKKILEILKCEYLFSKSRKTVNPICEGHFYTDLFLIEKKKSLRSKASVNHCQPRSSRCQEDRRTMWFNPTALIFHSESWDQKTLKLWTSARNLPTLLSFVHNLLKGIKPTPKQ